MNQLTDKDLAAFHKDHLDGKPVPVLTIIRNLQAANVRERRVREAVDVLRRERCEPQYPNTTWNVARTSGVDFAIDLLAGALTRKENP